MDVFIRIFALLSGLSGKAASRLRYWLSVMGLVLGALAVGLLKRIGLGAPWMPQVQFYNMHGVRFSVRLKPPRLRRRLLSKMFSPSIRERAIRSKPFYMRQHQEPLPILTKTPSGNC